VTVGLCLHTGGHRQRRLADRLAEMAALLGREAAVYPWALSALAGGRAPGRVGGGPARPAASFKAWAKGKEVVVFVGACREHHVGLARAQGALAYCLFDGTDLPDADDPAVLAGLKAVGLVTASARARADLAARFGEPVLYAPWDPGAPRTRRPPPAPGAPLVAAVYGPEAPGGESAAFLAAEQLLAEGPADLAVCALLDGPGPSGRRWAAWRRLGGRHGRHRLRLERLAARPKAAWRALLAASALAVLPDRAESVGEVGLEALAAGCPLVCYDAPVLSEYAKDGYNARLVGCDLVAGPLGLARAVPRRGDLARAALEVAADPALRARLAAGAYAGLEGRFRVFYRAWSHLLRSER
jgi:hypothetical protein